MVRSWCLRPVSIVRKTHLTYWTKVDEVSTPNLSTNRHLTIQVTNHNQNPKIPKIPFRSNLVKVKVKLLKIQKSTESTQLSQPSLVNSASVRGAYSGVTLGILLCLTILESLAAYARHNPGTLGVTLDFFFVPLSA